MYISFETCVHTETYNGPLTSAMRHRLGMGTVGCPYQGTTTCHVCPFVPVLECDYNCARCQVRGMCKCGHDQTARLQAWGKVE